MLSTWKKTRCINAYLFFTRLVKINSIYKSNDDKLFDRVENIVGKGENACCQHFLHSLKVASLSGWLELGVRIHQPFSRTFFVFFSRICKLANYTIWSCVTFICFLTLSQKSPGFYVSAVQAFWKHCGKRRNCSWRAISPFPTVFSTCLKNFLPFSSNLNCRLQSLSVWKSLKFVVW